MKFNLKAVAAAAALALATAASGAFAQPAFSVHIFVDENGNGIFTNTAGSHLSLASGLQDDIGPGGLPGVLTYDLLDPPGLTSGDVLIDAPGIGFDDVMRFNASEISPDGGVGSMVIYSNPASGSGSIGDTLSPPGALYADTITLTEVALGGGRFGVNYTPTAGEPGFVAGAGGPVTYTFVSIGAIPEPATWALMILGVGAAGAALRGKRKAALA